ncbi:MAG: hypothetical protein R2728_12270 [Chitinophagales bacterium]
MIRIVVTVFLILFVAFLVLKFIEPFRKKKGICQKCDGKGYWLGTRGREQCDWCKGSGKELN